MNSSSTHFQLLKSSKDTKNPILKPCMGNFAQLQENFGTSKTIRNNISNSIGWKWMITTITMVVLLFGLEKSANATTRYWVTGGTTAAFNDGTNWSLTTGGTKIGGTITWVAADVATFDTHSGSPSVTINGNYSITTLTISSGTVSLSGSSVTLSLSGTGATGGYLVGTGTTLTIGTGVTVAVTGAAPFTGFRGTTIGPGTILLNLTGISFPGSGTFNTTTPPNVTITNSFAATAGANVTVANLSIGTSTASTTTKLTLGNNVSLTVLGTFSNYGSTANDGLVGANNAVIIFSGTSQSFPQGAGTGGVFSSTPNVTIANGKAVTLDANVSLTNLVIGTSASATSLTLNKSATNYTATVSGTFTNFGTTGNGLIGPGTISFTGNNVSFPGSGVFTSAPSVTLANGNTYTNNATVTVNNLSIGTSTSANNAAKLSLSTGNNLTVTGTFVNYGSKNNDGLVGAGTGTIIFSNTTTAQTFPQGGPSIATGGIFSSKPNVVIATGATVTADAAVSLGTLTINSTAQFKDGGKIVTVAGNVTNSGSHTGAGSITLSGSSAERTLSGGGSYTNLTLNDANGAYLNSNATINGTLTLTTGLLNAGYNGDTVFISSTGSVTRTNGWVYGFLAKNFSSGTLSQTFQVGDSTTNYRPVTVTFASVSTPGYLAISNTSAIFSPQPTIVAQDVAAYWSIVNHVIAPSSASVTFNYLAGDVIGSQGNFAVQTYNGTSWLAPWTTTNPTGTSTTASGVTTFGTFAIGETGQAVVVRAAGPLTFCAGGSVVLQSTVVGAGTYSSYSWYQNSSPVGSSATNYTATTAGQYYLQVKDASNNIYYSDTLSVTVNPNPTANAGSGVPAICQSGTTAALGGSYGGGATAAVWSDGGAGGTFANNTGSTPNTTTYTASATASSPVTLTLTTSGGSCGTTNASQSLTVNSAPAASLSFNSPAIICEGAPVVITNTTAGAFTYQWMLNGAPILGANSSSYAASSAGAYTLTLTSTVTGCSGAQSAAVEVAELPQITVDTVYIPANSISADTFINLTMPTLSSYSVLPAGCNVNMSAATVVTTTIGVGGSGVYIICNGGNITVAGTGANTFVVEPGGTLTGFGGGGGNTAYIKSGGTYNPTSTGTPGGNTIYYEPGAIITASLGSYGQATCNNIGVIYPAATSDGCTPYTYLWSNADTSSTATVSALTNGTYYVTVTQGNFSCIDSAVVARLPYTWVGGNNANDWSTASNWNPNGIPNGCSNSVIIPVNGNDPVVNSPIAIGDVTITGNGTEVITLNSNLSVCGNVAANIGASTSLSGSAQAILNGSAAQTLGGNLSFGTLVLDNTSGGVSLTAGTEVYINTSLVLQTGNINTNAGTLTFNSAALNQSAIIDNFSNNTYSGSITGNITAQRYYGTAALFGQHMIGSPVSGITNGSLGSANNSGAYITPTVNCDELNSAANTVYGNVFSYHEAHGTTCTMAEWYVEPSASTTNPGEGYSVVLTHPGSTFQLTGTANLNTSYPMTGLTNHGWTNTSLQGRTFIAGWSLLSNPYLAPLNASALISDNAASFDKGILIWNNTTGKYEPATVIAPFQAFLVHRSVTDDIGATYNINGADRVIALDTFSRVSAPEVLTLTATNTSTGLTDDLTVGFDASALISFDPRFDFYKMPGDLSRHTLYALDDNNLWRMRTYGPSISQTPAVTVGFEPAASGNYSFSFEGVSSFDPTTYIILEDKQLNVMYNVRDGAYNYTSNATDNWNRFVLHFTPPAVINATNATCDAPGMISIQQPGTAIWNYTVADANNTILSSGLLNSSSQIAVNTPAGIYTLTLTDNNGYTVVKNIQVNGEQPVIASIAASVKTAEQNQEVTFIGAADNTSTYSWIFGDESTATGSRVTHIYQNEGIYNVVMNAVNASGCTSQVTQTITVTSRSTTGVTNLNGATNINVWSNNSLLYVDFTQVAAVEATIDIYDVLGQKLYSDRYTDNAVYMKQITNIEVGYILVRVKNNNEIITKKVFISNDK